MKKAVYLVVFFLFLFLSGCSDDISTALGEYRAVWKEDYQYNTPILIDSYEKWTEFREQHPQQSTAEDVLREEFDQQFFKDNVIYAYIKYEGSGSVKIRADKAVITEGNILNLHMTRTVPPLGTTDMAARICLFGIDRGVNDSIEKVQPIISERRG